MQNNLADIFYYYIPKEHNRTIVQWRIYYSDGSTFDSNDGSWEEAPRFGVQVVILFEDKVDKLNRPYRFIMSGMDFYFKDNDMFGQSFNNSEHVKGNVKLGSYIPDEQYEIIRRIAMEDYKL